MMADRLAGKVVLITGASRGIGAACAVQCAREGANVAIAAKTLHPHPKLPGTLADVAQAIRDTCGRDALKLQVDVRDAEQIEQMVRQTVEHFGRLDALVHNAGAIHLANVANWTAKRLDLVMSINVRAGCLAAAAALPHLQVHGGHVLMMSPPVQFEVLPGKAPYMISKFGMTMLAMAIDAEESNISACSLWPATAIQTAATQMLGIGAPELCRTPQILADATVLLLSRDAAHCSFRAWLDEEVLREHGISDFSPYRCDPDHEPPPLTQWFSNTR